MGDAGEGLIDAESRIQERMEELERERTQKNARPVRDPELVSALESLRLARTELAGQLASTTNDRRKSQIGQAIEEIDRRITVARGLRSVGGHQSVPTDCPQSGWRSPGQLPILSKFRSFRPASEPPIGNCAVLIHARCVAGGATDCPADYRGYRLNDRRLTDCCSIALGLGNRSQASPRGVPPR